MWSSPVFERSEWIPLSAAVVAESDHLTVFLRGYSDYSRLMNTRFRDVNLTDVTHREHP